MKLRIQSLFAGLALLASAILPAHAIMPRPIPTPIITSLSVPQNGGPNWLMEIRNTMPGGSYVVLASTNIYGNWVPVSQFTNMSSDPIVELSFPTNSWDPQSAHGFFRLYDLYVGEFGVFDYYFSPTIAYTNSDGAIPLGVH